MLFIWSPPSHLGDNNTAPGTQNIVNLQHQNTKYCVTYSLTTIAEATTIMIIIRRDNLERIIWGSYGLKDQLPGWFIENGSFKFLWDAMFQCDHQIRHQKPDTNMVNKIGTACLIINIVYPGENSIEEKEEKVTNRSGKYAGCGKWRDWLLPVITSTHGSINVYLPIWPPQKLVKIWR